MFVIEEGSDAYRYLANTFANGMAYKLSVEVRKEGIAFKINEGMWTPTLSISTHTHSWEEVNVEGPTHNGILFVTEKCSECHSTRSYPDSVN